MRESDQKAPSLRSQGWTSYNPFSIVRWLYDWVLGLANSPHAVPALFIISLAEASFFPVPPDVLLIALAISLPARALWFSAVCTLGSLAGAVAGYGLGYEFYELVGRPIIDFYAAEETYERVKQLYRDWDVLAVAVAGFTPIPYKVITITAGAFKINFMTFIVVSALSRGARFFLVGGLIRWLGPEIKKLIDRYFNLLTIVFSMLLLGGFLLLKYVI